MDLNYDAGPVEIFHVVIFCVLTSYLLGYKLVILEHLVHLNINCLQLCVGQMKPMCYICKRRWLQKNIYNGKQRKVL